MDLLLSGYPSLKDLHDPEGYIANLTGLLLEYAHDDAKAAVFWVADHGGEFPPTRFALRQACEKAAINRRLKGRAVVFADEVPGGIPGIV